MGKAVMSKSGIKNVEALAALSAIAVGIGAVLGLQVLRANAQAPVPATAADPTGQQPITVISDIQEADSKTGIMTARGNVQVFYPARELQGTSDQAQYFRNERIIVMTGNVVIIEQGVNTLEGETVTYLIDEDRIVAQPLDNEQVTSVYFIEDGQLTPAEEEPIPSLPDPDPFPELDAVPASPTTAPEADLVPTPDLAPEILVEPFSSEPTVDDF
ncbi:MAG: LptA/OstA family protein [Cyanobacteria bacterium P01_H01_bin.121]